MTPAEIRRYLRAVAERWILDIDQKLGRNSSKSERQSSTGAKLGPLYRVRTRSKGCLEVDAIVPQTNLILLHRLHSEIDNWLVDQVDMRLRDLDGTDEQLRWVDPKGHVVVKSGDPSEEPTTALQFFATVFSKQVNDPTFPYSDFRKVAQELLLIHSSNSHAGIIFNRLSDALLRVELGCDLDLFASDRHPPANVRELRMVQLKILCFVECWAAADVSRRGCKKRAYERAKELKGPERNTAQHWLTNVSEALGRGFVQIRLESAATDGRRILELLEETGLCAEEAVDRDELIQKYSDANFSRLVDQWNAVRP